ncbi:MAG: hypothetical protein K0Q94_2738 [Paenibacillus sp.]|nr:hypothetical protein [Paenibacillus sp.]
MTQIQTLAGYVNPNDCTLERAQKLMAAAERNPFKEIAFPSHLNSMELLNLLLQYQEHLSKLDQSISSKSPYAATAAAWELKSLAAAAFILFNYSTRS